MIKRLGFFLVVLSFVACNSEKEVKPDVSDIKVSFSLNDKGDEMFKINTKESVDSFMVANSALARQYFKVEPGKIDSQAKDFIARYYANPALKDFYKYTDSAFAGYPLQGQIEQLYKYLKYYYPDYTTPEVNTVVTGFNFDEISVSDSLLVISLDYFLGPQSKYRPQLYNYMLSRYDKDYVVPFLALAISYKYNKENPEDKTMLAHMIHHGKALYFMKKVLPDHHDSLLVMYSEQTLKDVNDNADVIYAHFVKNKLFFETRPKMVEKYIGESPKVDEIGDKCPGRIGRWLGLEIVKAYMKENPDITLQDLMQETDAQKIFRESKYRPEKK